MMKFQRNLKHHSVLLLLSFVLSFSLLCSPASAGTTTGDDDGRRRRQRSSSSSRRLHGPNLVDAHRRFEDRTRSAFELIRSKKQPQHNNATTAASAAATGHTNTDDDEGGNGDDGGDSTSTGSTHNRHLEPVTSTTSRQQKAKSSKKTTRKSTTKNDNDNDDDVCKVELDGIEKELAMTEQDLANTRMDLQESNEELNECQDKLDEESGSTQLYVQMAKSCKVYREKKEEGEDDGNSNKYTYYLSTSEMAKETWQFADRPLRTETTIDTNYFVHAFSEMFFTEETGGSPNAAFTFVNLDEDEFEGPLVSIIIKTASVINNAASNISSSEDVFCDIDGDGDSDHHFTNCNTYTYELEQSEDQSGILSIEEFFGHDYQVDNPDLIEYDDCSIFIDSYSISEPNAFSLLASPCCNCVSFNNRMDCIEYGDICVDCTTIVTEAEGFKANIYWPLTTVQEPLPVISWGHGLSNHGHRLDASRRNLFVFFAKLGFVVIAHRLDHGSISENRELQLKALDVLYESDEFTSLVDPNGITVLAGYSMGGAGTLNNANKRDIIDKYNIKAAIAFHPFIPVRCSYASRIPIIPTMFATGTTDLVASYDNTYSQYFRTVLVNKVFIGRQGQGHQQPDNFLYDNDSSMESAIIDFIECEVFNNEKHCLDLYGTNDISTNVANGVPYNITHIPGQHPEWQSPVKGYPDKNLKWANERNYGYDVGRTAKYRLTSGSKSCDSDRDCNGRFNWCLAQCINPIHCGKRGNCQLCK